MRFEFASPVKIIFGRGTLHQLTPPGQRVLLVTGKNTRRVPALSEILQKAGAVANLQKAGATVIPFSVPGEPSIKLVQDGVARAKEQKCDSVISLGGGSVLDAGKAIAALLTNDGDIFDYLEVIGHGQPLLRPGAPFIAIPTTAGTGSEVTRNAVLFSPEHQVKVSMRSPLMLARVALVDPELTLTLPPEVTASTGMDALTQVIEPYVSCRANPMTDALCKEGIIRAARSLRRAYENGDDIEAREDMALASLFGGLALSNAGLGAVHGFAGPIGGMFNAPHGAICAVLLPHVMKANLQALRVRVPQSPVIHRYNEIARWLTGKPGVTGEDGGEWVSSLVAALKIPSLGTYGIETKNLDLIVDKTSVSSSMKGNPLPLDRGELTDILKKAI